MHLSNFNFSQLFPGNVRSVMNRATPAVMRFLLCLVRVAGGKQTVVSLLVSNYSFSGALFIGFQVGWPVNHE